MIPIHDIRDLSAAALTALLYVAPLLFLPLCLYFFAKRRRRLAWICAAIAIVSLAPLAAFLIVYYDAVTFPVRRQAEISVSRLRATSARR